MGASMDLLHTTQVAPGQIDHLGHMNVRYYAEHARTGGSALIGSLGLAADDGPAFRLGDLYIRHHREQMVDARLAVLGGVLSVESDRLRLYEELVNVETDEIAATYVVSYEPVDPADRSIRPISDEAVDAARERTVAVPERGRPRSIAIDDDPTADAPSLEELRARDLAMRRVRTVAEEACDAEGYLDANAVAELVWGGIPLEGHEFEPFHLTAEGVRIAWATMETRGTWARQPQAGDRVQSFGAELEINDKTTLTRHWVFDVDRADLVCTFAVVGLAFDLEARRAVVIPDAVREAFAERLHPDLASTIVRPRGD